MLGALLIVFREVIEGGLIIGILFGATRGLPGRGFWIGAGAAAGVAGAGLVAVFAGAISALMQGRGHALFDAAILFAAVGMLAWHNVFMARHGRELARELKSAGAAAVSGAAAAPLALAAAIAILREGSETVLFLYGLLAGGEKGAGVAFGALGGLALGALTSLAIYGGLLKLSMNRFFAVTGALIAFVAAGMAAEGVSLLQDAGVLRVLTQKLWDTSAILSSEGSIAGRALHALMGYDDNPSALQMLVYGATLAAIFGLMRAIARQPAPTPRGA
ncbi:MAG: FTR1 family protein [Hyphomicrobiales bacterium]|nr:FTR1 family protein [Hyphomicrobiales bacterium]MDE2017099.1 FTR1 family protein [Hyphomicrobiales bacterium]